MGASDRPAIPSLLVAVFDVPSSTPALVERRVPHTDTPLAHFGRQVMRNAGLRKGSQNKRNR